MAMSPLNDRVMIQLLFGLDLARKEYKRLAKLPVTDAPESFLATICAAQLHALKGVRRVTLESNITSTLANSGADGRRLRTNMFKGNKRFDIVVWNEEGPYGLVEIKHAIAKSERAVEKDAQRLGKAVCAGKGKGFPKFGFLAFDVYRNKSPRYKGLTLFEQLVSSIFYIEESVRYYTRDLPVSFRSMYGLHVTDGDTIWCPVAMQFRRKGR